MAVVVAQLVEQLLPTPEIRCLNPVNGKFDLLSIVLNRKDRNEEKRWRE